MKAFSIHGMTNKAFFGPDILTLGNAFPQPKPAPPPAGNWTAQTGYPFSNVQGITASATRIVVTDGNGGTAFSDDHAVSWTVGSGFTGAHDGFALGFHAGLWVAASSDGTIQNSADGATWTTVANIGPFFGQPSIQFGNGVWLVVTASSAENVNVFTSANGTVWTNEGTTTPDILRLFGFNGTDFFGSQGNSVSIFSTPDGTTGSYTLTPAPEFNANGVRSMAFNGTLYVATDRIQVVESSPSLVWTPTPITTPLNDDNTAVTWNGSAWIFVGDSLSVLHPQAAVSTDLVTFSLEDMDLGDGENENVKNVVFLTGTVIAYTFDGVFTTRS